MNSREQGLNGCLRAFDCVVEVGQNLVGSERGPKLNGPRGGKPHVIGGQLIGIFEASPADT